MFICKKCGRKCSSQIMNKKSYNITNNNFSRNILVHTWICTECSEKRVAYFKGNPKKREYAYDDWATIK